MDKFEIETYSAIRALDIPAHIKGYEFIKSALRYLRNNPNSIYAVTKDLYPSVAKMHGENVEGSHVERGIRHAISLSRADDKTWLSVMGRARPMSNSEFIATLNEAIKIKLASEKAEVIKK